jgi:hypothetical protein
MRSLIVLIFSVSFLLCFLPSGAYSLDVYGIEVGNTMSFQGTYIAGEAQVRNPGFEQGKTGWFMARTSETDCSFTIDADTYEGSKAAKLIVTNEGYCMLGNSTSILILRTGTYTLNVYAKVAGDVDHITIAVWKSFDADTNPDIPVGYINPNVFSGDYELHQLTVDLIAGEYIRLELGIDNNASGPSYALFDKVELVNPSGPYAWAKEVASIDPTTFSPTTTHVIEYTMEGSAVGKDWFETTFSELATPSESRLWGEEDIYGDFYRYSSGLVTTWYPMQVNDHKYSSATIDIEGYTFNASLTADVLTVESVDLGFDTLEAYKLRYVPRIWGYGLDIRTTFYHWWVPYLGFVKYQDEGVSEILTDFAIGGGTITQNTDTDSDGLKDYQELVIYNTDRLDSDTDDDGLSDFDEVNTYDSDPNDNDTDDDGLTDGDEVNTYDTDPINEDTDDDGLSDGDEVNTYDTDPKDEDTDGDELSDGDEIAIGTDPKNPDTDLDGMPDGWEDTYGLDPLTDDAGIDADGDGLTNLEEYNLGRHPTNVEPDTPLLLAPGDTETDISLTPQLQTQSFSDADGHDHASTHWQIGKRIGNPDPCTEESFTNSDYIVFDGTSDSQLTLFNVPDFLLEADTDYCWRARFTDTGGATSEWADPFAFKTVSTDENDQNQNGVPDDQEVDDPNLDLDNNGTPDMNQGDMKCVNTAGGAAQISVKQGTHVTSIESLRWTDPDTINDTQNKPDNLPLGLVSFKLIVDNAGDTAEVTVYLSEPAPAGAKWYRYDTINGWQDYSAHAVFSLDRKSVTLQFEDGGAGDADGVANAVIIDPSGLGTSSSGSGGGGGGGGGGGCFISTASSDFSMSKEILAIVLVFGSLLICRSGLKKIEK